MPILKKASKRMQKGLKKNKKKQKEEELVKTSLQAASEVLKKSLDNFLND